MDRRRAQARDPPTGDHPSTPSLSEEYLRLRPRDTWDGARRSRRSAPSLTVQRRAATVPSTARTRHVGQGIDPGSTVPGRARVTTHPPNPAPVIRAPNTP